MSEPGTNTGHGHVWTRPDGVKARCGGPGLCSTCSADLSRTTGRDRLDAFTRVSHRAREWLVAIQDELEADVRQLNRDWPPSLVGEGQINKLAEELVRLGWRKP